MPFQADLFRLVRPALHKWPVLRDRLVQLDQMVTRERHELAKQFPLLIKPQPRLLHVAITAHCNLRCVGCLYGRDFMPGKSLPLPLVITLLEDARETGFQTVRLYGGGVYIFNF